MNINIQQCSNVTVVGHRTSKNCKAVYNITTGEIYASCLDAADAIGSTLGAVSQTLNGKTNTCKGMRLCFVSKMMEHLEEITEVNRIRSEKVAAYDAIVAEQNAKKQAQENLVKHQANIEALRQKLEKEMQLMQEAQALCSNQ
jgi:hypothetical protein